MVGSNSAVRNGAPVFLCLCILVPQSGVLRTAVATLARILLTKCLSQLLIGSLARDLLAIACSSVLRPVSNLESFVCSSDRSLVGASREPCSPSHRRRVDVVLLLMTCAELTGSVSNLRVPIRFSLEPKGNEQSELLRTEGCRPSGVDPQPIAFEQSNGDTAVGTFGERFLVPYLGTFARPNLLPELGWYSCPGRLEGLV